MYQSMYQKLIVDIDDSGMRVKENVICFGALIT